MDPPARSCRVSSTRCCPTLADDTIAESGAESLDALLRRVRGCRLCETHLPLGPRPVVQIGATARVLLIGQAPGTKVHASGRPFTDPSGDRLRAWMGIDETVFYDAGRLCIMPMGFCYPGTLQRGGDAPPRPECAPQWHDLLRAKMPAIELVLLVGQYAQRRYLGARAQKTLTETVQRFRDYGPDLLPLPHPSWRNTAWMKKNPWFEQEVIPHLRARVADLV